MLLRRVLAFPTVICLLLSLLAIPQGPMLVCRMTGEPMTPIAAPSPNAQGSCCDVAANIDTDGTAQYALTAPGCCDLIKGTVHPNVPAVTAPSLELPAAALLVASPALPPLPLTRLAPLLEAPREVAPRAPPRTDAAPRAPPFS